MSNYIKSCEASFIRANSTFPMHFFLRNSFDSQANGSSFVVPSRRPFIPNRFHNANQNQPSTPPLNHHTLHQKTNQALQTVLSCAAGLINSIRNAQVLQVVLGLDHQTGCFQGRQGDLLLWRRPSCSVPHDDQSVPASNALNCSSQPRNGDHLRLFPAATRPVSRQHKEERALYVPGRKRVKESARRLVCWVILFRWCAAFRQDEFGSKKSVLTNLGVTGLVRLYCGASLGLRDHVP